MSAKFEAEVISPWTYIKGHEEIYNKFYKCEVVKLTTI